VRTIPSLLLADLQSDATSLAFIWAITMADGRKIRGTEHDQDITIPPAGSPDPNAGTYYAVANITLGDVTSNSDLSVDNLEVSGALSPTAGESTGKATVLDVSVDDIEAGLLDLAPVSIMICNWRAPSHGYFEVKTGTLGAISHNSDGKYTTEVRGMTQLLAQTIIRTFSASCNVVKFGDIRCGFNVAAHTITGSVSADTSGNRIQFGVDLDPGSPASGFSYQGGILTFTSGANSGYSREVKADPNANGGIIVFWESFPEDVNHGDAFTLSPGCDRQQATCKIYGRFAPAAATGDRGGWKGYGVFIPGVNAITAGPPTAGTGIL
jgi:uncharacterized phage protein (TIGR02218 family)